MLALLLSGLLQPLAAAQGLMCALPHAPAGASQQAYDESAAEEKEGAPETAHPSSLGEAHDHSKVPQPDGPRVPAAPCGVVVLPVRPAPLLHSLDVQSVLSQDELPPPSSLLESLFRPPRLS